MTTKTQTEIEEIAYEVATLILEAINILMENKAFSRIEAHKVLLQAIEMLVSLRP